ncbi:MAG: hypothetical protein ACYC49_00380 [Ignavibacteriaceae bacterium]
MNKKLWTGFIAVWIVYGILEWLVNVVILHSAYMSGDVAKWMRPNGEIKLWVIYVAYLFFAFFFTLIFSKGFENKGIIEGVRYGIYVGLMVSLPAAYVSYATMPMPYTLALQWFLYGMIEMILCGIVLAFVYKPKESKATTAS